MSVPLKTKISDEEAMRNEENNIAEVITNVFIILLKKVFS
jgi:hypothetical protein